MSKATRVDLVVIDPQNDFCDPKGALYVKGAEKDMDRLTKFVNRTAKKLANIAVTLDSHHLLDLAHPGFWRDSKGKSPAPFTIISSSDIEQGRWTPFQPSLTKRMVAYAKALETGGRYPLCVWPPHCLIGSAGAAVYPSLFEALNGWASETGSIIEWVSKGSNVFTEHYSAVRAEVPDSQDPSTMINADFINRLMEADMIAIAGEAGSHCVANTVTDIANEFKDDSFVKKIVLLEGCYSPVPIPLPDGTDLGLKMQTDFIKEMTGRGMQVVKSSDFLA